MRDRRDDQMRKLMERIDRLQWAVKSALHRYDNPDEPHNIRGGFQRGELAWVMQSDLRDNLIDGDLDNWPNPREPDPAPNPWTHPTPAASTPPTPDTLAGR